MPSTSVQPARRFLRMIELFRSTDPVTISRVTSLLEGEGIAVFEMDTYMSVLEGSIGILPRRIMIANRDEFMARAILREAGLIE